jgi:hypothetical protein
MLWLRKPREEQPMPDLFMETCRLVGEQLANPMDYPMLPVGSLPDECAIIKLVRDVETPITKAILISPNAIRPVACVVLVVCADTTLKGLAEASLPNQQPNVAVGMAMRYYAGFLEMAKALRYDENADGGGKTFITAPMRASYMAAIHTLAQRDAIFAAGAKFGWWGIKRPDRPVPENVFDDGIDAVDKREYLADYYRQYPSAGAPSSGSAAAGS